MNKEKLQKQVREILFDLATHIPQPKVKPLGEVEEQVRKVIREASWKAAAISGALSMPGGPVGLLTIFPDLITVWKIQSQMVADIAFLYGQSNKLDRDMMIQCLFVQGQSNMQDLLMRAGERATLRVGRRLVGEGLARWVPVVGAVAVGRYVRKDTVKVGENAREVFNS